MITKVTLYWDKTQTLCMTIHVLQAITITISVQTVRCYILNSQLLIIRVSEREDNQNKMTD